MNPMQPMSTRCLGIGSKKGVGAAVRAATPTRQALVLALVAAGLAGCGADPQTGPVTSTTRAAGLASTAAPGPSNPVEDAAAPTVTPPTARAQTADPSQPLAGSLHMALLPFGEMPLPDGRVERSYRLQLHNKGSALPAATLELAEVPPGVEVVRGRIGTAALAAQASSSPSETLILRFRETLAVDVSALAWRWTAAAPRAAHPVARLLVGDPAARAVSALSVLAAAGDGGTGERLLALLAPQAQVGEVNAALRRTQLHIDEMRPGNHTLVLTRAGLGAGPLAQAASQLQASGAFERVTLAGPAVQSVAGGFGVGRSAVSPASRLYDGTVEDGCSD